MLSAKEIVEFRKNPVANSISFSAKGFEPNGSLEEMCQIENSLSEIEKIISNERLKKVGSLSQAVWKAELQLAEVTHQTGSKWLKLGHRINKKLFLYPEEALYLLETGSLEISYNEVPLSIQRAYFVLLGPNSGISIEKYRVYSYLNAIGYKVTRHSKIIYQEELELLKFIDKNSKRVRSSPELHTSNSESTKKLKADETKLPSISIESKNAIEVLQNIKYFRPCDDICKSEIDVDFDVYLPSKKKSLKVPNCRILIHRGDEPMPDINKITGLNRKYNDNIPIMNAIVFPDYITFYMINQIILPDAFS